MEYESLRFYLPELLPRRELIVEFGKEPSVTSFAGGGL